MLLILSVSMFDIVILYSFSSFFDIKSALREALSVTVIVMRGLSRVMIGIYADATHEMEKK